MWSNLVLVTIIKPDEWFGPIKSLICLNKEVKILSFLTRISIVERLIYVNKKVESIMIILETLKTPVKIVVTRCDIILYLDFIQ